MLDRSWNVQGNVFPWKCLISCLIHINLLPIIDWNWSINKYKLSYKNSTNRIGRLDKHMWLWFNSKCTLYMIGSPTSKDWKWRYKGIVFWSLRLYKGTDLLLSWHGSDLLLRVISFKLNLSIGNLEVQNDLNDVVSWYFIVWFLCWTPFGVPLVEHDLGVFQG